MTKRKDSTDDEHLTEVERVLWAVLDAEEAQRPALLDQLCSGKPELRASVESLLARVAHLDGFLEEPVLQAFVDEEPAPLEVGQSLGTYRVVKELGRGGMSVVYLGERDDQAFRHQVAIKVIGPGVLSQAFRQRFLAERQILAELSHPNIARLYDGGSTEQGLPYIVLEHIEGEPIDRYCQRHELSVSERIQLFRQVCAAVQHAHQSLIVHRDLKPGNILVDTQGTPKLLDFGIAGLLHPTRSDKEAAHTVTRLHLMTPSYASPEQIQGRRPGTASDVYSLGVILYKLLCGRLPHHFASSAPQQWLAVMERDLPTLPSHVLRQGWPEREGEAAREPAPRRARELAGDLDAIVLKALRFKPAQRYSSVEALDDDLRRYLEGRPVQARRGSTLYRAGKLASRHRVSLTVAVVLGLAVLLSAAQALRGAATVAREQRHTAAVVEFLVSLFWVPEERAAEAEAISARELLDRGLESIGSDLATQPGVRATLEETVGRAYTNLGLATRAVPTLRKALDARADLDGAEHLKTLETQHYLAQALLRAGQLEESATLFREILAQTADRAPQPVAWQADFRLGLARILQQRGELEEAENLAQQAVAIYRQIDGGEGPDSAVAIVRLAEVLRDRGDYGRAQDLYVRALSLHRQHPQDPLSRASLNQSYGYLLIIQDHGDLALPLFEEALATRRELLGKEHPSSVEALGSVANALSLMRRFEEAEVLGREAMELTIARFGGLHPAVARTRYNLATTLSQMQRYDEAEPIFRQLVALATLMLGEASPHVANTRVSLAEVLMQMGRVEEAETLLRKATEQLTEGLDARQSARGKSRMLLGKLLCARGDYEEAMPLLEESMIAVRTLWSGGWALVGVEMDLAICQLRQGLYDEAMPTIERNIARMRRDLRPGDPMLALYKAEVDRLLGEKGLAPLP